MPSKTCDCGKSKNKVKKTPTLTSLQLAEQNKLRPRRKQVGPSQPEDTIPRVIINRVYIRNQRIRFNPELPEKLRDRSVDDAIWTKTLEGMYEFLDKGAESGIKTCFETVGSVITVNLLWYLRRTTFEKNVEKLVGFLHEQNQSFYNRLSLHIVDPTVNGFRELEILLLPFEPVPIVAAICPVESDNENNVL